MKLAPVSAILSLLHEPRSGPDSTRRSFRSAPVLAWTLLRLHRARLVKDKAILCWEDQLPRVQPIAEAAEAYVLAKGPRVPIPALDAVTAARRWSDGWRGGLLRTCEFDRGFHGGWMSELAGKLGVDETLLVDPSAALIDPALVDQLISHAALNPNWPLVFSQAAPGLSSVLIRTPLLKQLADVQSHPGRFLHYNPEQPTRDPIAETSCAPVATPVARTLHRFTLDSSRQIDRISRATVALNGQLITTGAEGLVAAMNQCDPQDPLPREVVLELTTRRATRPIFAPVTHLDINRPDLSLPTAEKLFEQLAASDDMRLTLAGVGDPLLHPQFWEILDAATHAGIRAIHVRTDLLDIAPAMLKRLASSDIDVLSVNIPAVSGRTYLQTMQVDGLARVLASLKLLQEERSAAGRAAPIVVPTFTKCRENLAEMESWYDQWLMSHGNAVIVGASDFAGQIPDHAAADMSPPARRACARLGSRITLLSDGRIAACEQDALGKFPLGLFPTNSVTEAWTQRVAALRSDHRFGEWKKHPLCACCREWHRP